MELGIGLAVGLGVGLGGAPAAAGDAPRVGRPVPGRVAGHRVAGLRRRVDRPRLGLPRRLPGGARAGHGVRCPPSARSSPSTRGSAGSPRSSLFLTLGLLVFPVADRRRGAGGQRCSRWSSCSSRGPSASALATLLAGFTWPERVALGWAGLRGAVPMVLATFPVLGGVPEQPGVLQHRLLRRVCSRRCCRGRRSSGWRSVLGVTTTEAALPAPLADAGAVRRLGAEIVEYVVEADDAIVGARVRELGPAARRARQHRRARRAGDPAARLDADRGGRPAAPARPPGGRASSSARSASAGTPARSTCRSGARRPAPRATAR